MSDLCGYFTATSSPFHPSFIAARFTGRHVNERAEHNGIRLLMEGSVWGLLLGAWLWGMLALGSHATTVQTSPPTSSETTPMYGDACQASKTPEKEGVGCHGKFRPLIGTSREPGKGLAERSPRGES